MVLMNRKVRKEKLIKMVTLFYKKINELNDGIVLKLFISLFDTQISPNMKDFFLRLLTIIFLSFLISFIIQTEIVNLFAISLSHFSLL
jgi:hypothetical protein